MVKQAALVKAGEFVNVGDAYLGKVTAVSVSDGVARLSHALGDYEMDATVSVDAWPELPRVAARLPHCVAIDVKRYADRPGLSWVTRHNGRTIDCGWSAADETETRQFAKNMLEAMGLIQDGC
jgi:hypothetical protein